MRSCFGDTCEGPRRSQMFPANASLSRFSLPCGGSSRMCVRPLVGCVQSSQPVAVLRRTLTPDVHLDRSLCSLLNTVSRPPRIRLSQWSSGPNHGPGACWAVPPRNRFFSRTRQISPVPWEPPSRLARFSAPVAPDSPGHTASRLGPRNGSSHGLTTLLFRGSIDGHSSSLSTLRSRPHCAAHARLASGPPASATGWDW